MQFGWKDYFNFFRSERKGILFFILLIIVLCVYLYYLSIQQPKVISNFSELEAIKKASESIAENDTLKNTFNNHKAKNINAKDNISIELFEFNPNDASPHELEKLGFSNKLINTIINYRQKGGRFYHKEDLLKIYGMDTLLYKKIKPYIVYEKKTINTVFKTSARLININTCTKEDLIQLPGIGDKLSDRIIKFREALGGFYSIKQLQEVYGIQPEIYTKIKSQLTITNSIQKLNINKSSIDELSKHCYINYKLANLIVEYRNRHGNYNELSELKKLHLMTEETFIKIEPYLTVNE